MKRTLRAYSIALATPHPGTARAIAPHAALVPQALESRLKRTWHTGLSIFACAVLVGVAADSATSDASDFALQPSAQEGNKLAPVAMEEAVAAGAEKVDAGHLLESGIVSKGCADKPTWQD